MGRNNKTDGRSVNEKQKKQISGEYRPNDTVEFLPDSNQPETEELSTKSAVVKKNPPSTVESSINQRPRRKIKHKYIKCTRESPVAAVKAEEIESSSVVKPETSKSTTTLQSTKIKSKIQRKPSNIIVQEVEPELAKQSSITTSAISKTKTKNQNRTTEQYLRRSGRQNRPKDSTSNDTDESNLQMVEIIDDPSDDPNVSIQEILETCALDSEVYERMVNSSKDLPADSNTTISMVVPQEESVNSADESSLNSQDSQNSERKIQAKLNLCMTTTKQIGSDNNTFKGVFNKAPENTATEKCNIKPAPQFYSPIRTRRVTRLSSMSVSRSHESAFSKVKPKKIESSTDFEATEANFTEIVSEISHLSNLSETTKSQDDESDSIKSINFENYKTLIDTSASSKVLQAETVEIETENIPSLNATQTPTDDTMKNDELVRTTIDDSANFIVESGTCTNLDDAKCSQKVKSDKKYLIEGKSKASKVQRKKKSPMSENQVPTHDLTKQVPNFDLTQQVPTPDLTKQVPAPDITKQVPTPVLTKPVPTPELINQVPTSDLTKHVSIPDQAEQPSIPDLTKQVTAPDLTKQIPTSDLTKEIPTPDLTRQIPSPDLTKQVTTIDRSKQIPTSDLPKQIPYSDITKQVTTPDLTKEVPDPMKQIPTPDLTEQVSKVNMAAESEETIPKQESPYQDLKIEKHKIKKESNNDKAATSKDSKSRRSLEVKKKFEKSSQSTAQCKEKHIKFESKSSKSSSTDKKNKDSKSSETKKYHSSEVDLQSKKASKKDDRTEKEIALEQLKPLEQKSSHRTKPTIHSQKDSTERNRDSSTKTKIRSSTSSTTKVKSKSKDVLQNESKEENSSISKTFTDQPSYSRKIQQNESKDEKPNLSKPTADQSSTSRKSQQHEQKDDKPNVLKLFTDQQSTSRKTQQQIVSNTNKSKTNRSGTDFILSECYLPKQVKYDESLYSIEALKAAQAAQEEQMKADAEAARKARELLAAKEEQAKAARAAARLQRIEEAKAAERARAAAELAKQLEEAEAARAAKIAKAAAKVVRAKQLKESSSKTNDSPRIEGYGLFASKDDSQESRTLSPNIEKPHEILDQNFIPQSFKSSPAFVQYQRQQQGQQHGSDVNVKSEGLVISTEEEETNIRRSGRIKTITETKQRACGFGLVKDKDRFHSLYIGDLSYSSMSDSQYLSDYSSNSNSMIDLNEIEKDSEVESVVVKKEKTDEELQQERREVAEGLNLFKQIIECEFRCERTISKETKKMTCDCFLTKSEIERGELGCGEDCLNRLIFIECGSRCAVGDRCTNKRFQKLLNSDCTIFKAGKKGFGLRAVSYIAAGEFIMEYVGEVLDSKQFDDRRFKYSNDNIQHHYFMALRSDCVIDATIKGNISRFINHSCDPNAETQKWTVNGELRIGFFSTRPIQPDEEITFDYQFQRYGKAAQKCYCEAENCRGWIGEEPDSEDEEEEDEEDEEEEEEEEEAKTPTQIDEEQILVAKQPIIDETPTTENLIESPSVIQRQEEVIPEKPIEVVVPQTPTKKIKKPKTDQKPKKFKKTEIMEDPDLDHEIAKLMETNLKNQAQTLRLSRLMVRAKMLNGRSKLLSILRNGELACRRLFLDYHGLKLLHTWMCDSVTKSAQELWLFRSCILETLEVLPIPNKNMLQDSKVLMIVRKWSKTKSITDFVKSPEHSPSDSGSATPIFEGSSPHVEDAKNVDSLKNIPESKSDENDSSLQVSNVIKSEVHTTDFNEKNNDGVIEQVQIKSEEDNVNADLMELIRTITSKLLESWEPLKEVFRIPKKLRIEQMKEHEQEANRSSRDSGMTDTSDSNKRYNDPTRERDKDRFKKSKRIHHKESKDPDSNLLKEQRRRLFEAKMAQESADKRHFDKQLEVIHIAKCKYFQLDPRMTSFRDMPFSVSPLTGQWYSQDSRMVATPPSHVHIKPPQELPTNPDEYDLPPMDLPDQWKFAIDNKGRLYYYHVKIRIAQWEPPIKILPLRDEQSTHSVDIKTELNLSDDNEIDVKDESQTHQNISNEITSDKEDDSDLESSDAVDSSEDELMQKRQQLLNCFQANQTDLDISANLAVEISAMASTTEESTDQSFNLDNSIMHPSNKKKNRDGLATERLISPRTDEERLQSKIEMQRYKANKEKLRRRREDAKLRQHSSAEPTRKLKKLTEGLPVVSQQDDDPDETDDEDEASTSDLEIGGLNETFVDELDGIKTEKIRMDLQKTRADTLRLSRKISKRKRNEPEPVVTSTEAAKRLKDKFCAEMYGVIVQHLAPYRKDDCKIGRITNSDDFKHLARKLNYFVMLKELKHCENTSTILEVTDSVKTKSKEFIRKYMVKFGDVYVKAENDPEYKEFCNT